MTAFTTETASIYDDAARPLVNETERHFEVVEYATIWKGLRVALPIVVTAIIAALVVASAVLGTKLLLIGASVGFMMIMFIGLPLLLASINDALEQHE